MSEVFFLTWIQCNFGWTHLILIFLYYLKPCLQNQLLFSNNETVCHDAVSSSLHTEANTESPPPDSFFLIHFLFSFSEMIVRFLEAFILASSLPCIQVYQFIFFLFLVICISCSTGVSDNKVKMFTSPEKSEWPEHLHLTNFKLLLCKVT